MSAAILAALDRVALSHRHRVILMTSVPLRAPLGRALALATVAAALAATPALGQGAPRLHGGIGLSGGIAQFDMAGTGTAPFAAARLDYELASWLVADGALGVIRPDEQVSQRRAYLVPEVQVQIQLPAGRVRPYLGAGTGMLLSVRGQSRNYAVFSGATGVRAAVSDAIDLRGELRVTGPSATLAQWTLGVERRF